MLSVSENLLYEIYGKGFDIAYRNRTKILDGILRKMGFDPIELEKQFQRTLRKDRFTSQTLFDMKQDFIRKNRGNLEDYTQLSKRSLEDVLGKGKVSWSQAQPKSLLTGKPLNPVTKAAEEAKAVQQAAQEIPKPTTSSSTAADVVQQAENSSSPGLWSRLLGHANDHKLGYGLGASGLAAAGGGGALAYDKHQSAKAEQDALAAAIDSESSRRYGDQAMDWIQQNPYLAGGIGAGALVTGIGANMLRNKFKK